MSKFKIFYQENGRQKNITINAVDVKNLTNDINYPSNVINVIEIKNYKATLFKKYIKASKSDIVDLFNELNIMLQANLTFHESILLLMDHYNKKSIIYNILLSINTSLNNGTKIYYGLQKFQSSLGLLPILFIKLGEENGNIRHIIYSLNEILKNEEHNKRLIISKLSYPIILLVSLICALGIIFIFVIPEFEHMFTKLGANLPVITVILLSIKNFIFKYSFLILIIILISLFILFILYNKNISIQFKVDEILLTKLPFFSKLFLTQNMYRFFLVLKILVGSKYKLTIALNSVSTIINNKYFLYKIDIINKSIRSGDDILNAFIKSKLFDNFTNRMLFAGEKSNNTIKILEKLHVVYKEKLNKQIQNFSTILEPILIMLMGGIILFVMLSIFLPIWQMGIILK